MFLISCLTPLSDTLVRQAAMIVKCMLLMYYKNSKGRNYRRQGEMLTVVEYFLLLYRALLPTPVWYCFFLNKEYGSLFSSLTTGLYLTFKLTSVVEKVLTLSSHRHHVMVIIIFCITYLFLCYITGAIISNISESLVT
jgi:hypothetical protein